MVLERSDLIEQDIEINEDFILKYPIWSANLLILIGANAVYALEKLVKIMKDPPSIISLTSSKSSQFD